ncbi:MAG: SurA N-terminal domain-containing protein [Candidatus Omnitrophica bacterium]|nr:SurA N-terminal domain-containing protein [Candidatus Omnitrophota bacterium]
MLIRFKSHHTRKILWALIGVIVPAFMLWGGLSYFNSRSKDLAGKIENHRISQQELAKYLRLTQVGLLFQSPEAARSLTPEQIRSKTWQMYLFLWKAKKDKITVTDQEVVDALAGIFVRNGSFDRDWYFSILKRRRINPREFEEYIRASIIIDKLIAKYVAESPSEEEVLDLYKKENEKAKIDYLMVGYDKFPAPQEVTDEQVHKFYEENKIQFKQAPQMKLNYVLLEKERFTELKEKLIPLLKKSEHLEGFAKELGIKVNTTGYLTANSPIEGIGWEPNLVRAAFEAPLHSISPVYEIASGYVIFEKTEAKDSRIPPVSEIKNVVIEQYRTDSQKRQAQKYIEEILKEISEKKISDLATFAKGELVQYGESEYFKFYDYIPEVGLYSNVNEAIFSAQPGEIIKEVFSLPKAAYLVQLKEIVKYDPETFEKEKEEYRERISRQKFMVNQIKFLNQLQQESNLRIYVNPQQ